jgi:hypothetical protein
MPDSGHAPFAGDRQSRLIARLRPSCRRSAAEELPHYTFSEHLWCISRDIRYNQWIRSRLEDALRLESQFEFVPPRSRQSGDTFLRFNAWRTFPSLATRPAQSGETIMSGNHRDPGFEFDKELDIEVDVELDFETDVDVDVYKDVYIDIDVKSDVDLDGNTAELTLDVQALGDNTDVQSIVSVLTVDNEMSSISLWAFSATD